VLLFVFLCRSLDLVVNILALAHCFYSDQRSEVHS
jgi:hypothetical protein